MLRATTACFARCFLVICFTDVAMSVPQVCHRSAAAGPHHQANDPAGARQAGEVRPMRQSCTIHFESRRNVCVVLRVAAENERQRDG